MRALSTPVLARANESLSPQGASGARDRVPKSTSVWYPRLWLGPLSCTLVRSLGIGTPHNSEGPGRVGQMH